MSHSLPSVREQAQRLIDLEVHQAAGLSAALVTATADAATTDEPGLLVLPGAPITALAPLLQRNGKAGFVVSDMTDVEQFVPIAEVDVPSAPYLLTGIDRGDDLRNASPDEALPALTDRGRTPLTLTEGVFWLIAHPEALVDNHCFMTIGSRLRKPTGRLDARTPALWISGGTGRDGRERRGAPKIGWCWAGNRHTWLGFASATRRTALAT